MADGSKETRGQRRAEATLVERREVMASNEVYSYQMVGKMTNSTYRKLPSPTEQNVGLLASSRSLPRLHVIFSVARRRRRRIIDICQWARRK